MLDCLAILPSNVSINPRMLIVNARILSLKDATYKYFRQIQLAIRLLWALYIYKDARERITHWQIPHLSLLIDGVP